MLETSKSPEVKTAITAITAYIMISFIMDRILLILDNPFSILLE